MKHFLHGILSLALGFCMSSAAFAQSSIDISEKHPSFRELIFTDKDPYAIHLSSLQKGQIYYIALNSPIGRQVPFQVENLEPLGDAHYRASTDNARLILSDFETQGVYLSFSSGNNGLNGIRRAAGIVATSGQSAESLIRDVLIGGDCFDVEAVQPIGPGAGRGTFTADSNAIFLTEGVILASGNVGNAAGPNVAPSTGNNLGGGGDSDLNQLSGSTTFDAVGIEFDFTPTEDFVKFRYVFASEEYCEYVSTQFNDVFGFFLSGPGISGPFSNNAANIATIPGTGQYVAINNVNHNSFPEYYYDNTPLNSICNANCNYTTPPAPGLVSVCDTQGISVELVEYDGFTAIFEANLNVQPCETYHIKMVVADVGDGIFDSAVFLEGNSFNAGSEAQLEAGVVQTGGNEAPEGCYDAYLQITRLPSGNYALPLDIELFLNENSTATMGVDFSEIPASVTIPPFQESITIPIEIYADSIPEGIENILIETNFVCSCLNPFVELFIRDVPPIDVLVPDVTICEEQTTTLEAIASGGLEDQPYEYEWSDGEVTATRLAYPIETTTYTVTVTDYCGNTGTAEATVEVVAIPRAEMDGTIELCNPDEEAYVEIDLTGDGPFTIGYTINGVPQALIDEVEGPVFLLPVTDTGTYVLQSLFGQMDCFGQATGSVDVVLVGGAVEVDTGLISCAGGADGYLWLDPQGFEGQYEIEWSNGEETDSLNNLSAGEYSYLLIDSSGCSATDTFILEDPDSLHAAIEIISAPTCGADNGNLELVASGGTGDLTYTWSTGDTTLQVDGIGPGDYSVSVMDEKGCSRSDSLVLESSFPAIVLDSLEHITCVTDGYIRVSVQSGTPPITYNWTGIDAEGPEASVQEPGTYILKVSDSLDCASTDTFQIERLLDIPMADAGPDAVINCEQTSVILDASTSSGTGMLQYQWSELQGGVISGGDTAIIEVDQAGDYVLEVLDSGSGCLSRDTVSVSLSDDRPDINIDPPRQLNCEYQQVRIDATGSSSGPDYEYDWTSQNGNIVSGEHSLEPIVNAAGEYQLVVTNTTNACQSEANVTVQANFTTPEIDAGEDQTLSCEIESLELQGSLVAGNPTVNIQWSSTDGNIVSGGQSLNPLINRAGTYTVIATDPETGCQHSDEVEVLQDENLPLADAGPQMELDCVTGEINLDASGSDQGAFFTYSWSTTDGQIISGQNSLNPLVDAPGTYILEVTNTDNDCKATAQVMVSLDTTRPQIDAGPEKALTCEVEQVQLEGDAASPEYEISWTTTDGTIISGAGGLSPLVSAAGNYLITALDPANGCENSDAVAVVEDTTPPEADAGPEGEVGCDDTPWTLDGSNSSTGPEFTYQWIADEGQTISNGSSLQATTNEPGQYSLQVINESNGCVAFDTTSVIRNVIENAVFDKTNVSCIEGGGSIEVESVRGGLAPYAYELQPVGLHSSTGVFEDLDAGNYTVVVSDQRGCTWEEDLVITQPDPVQVDIIGQANIDLGQTVFLSLDLNKPLGEIQSISWSPPEAVDCDNCPEVSLEPLQDLEVSVVVTDKEGCTDMATVLLLVSVNPKVYIPNAFTPTDDAVNDKWVIFTNTVVEAIDEVQVFNRWGDKVFERRNIPPNQPKYGWDGTFDDQPAASGVYAYWVRLRLITGDTVFYKGELHLIR